MPKRELPEIGLVEYRRDFLNDHGYNYCERCGRSDGYNYEVHHIFYRSEQSKHKLINHRGNLVLLCGNCHRFLHSHKQERKNLKKFNWARSLFYNNDNINHPVGKSA